jgi:hypothetical protein
MSRPIGANFQTQNPEQITPFDMSNPDDRELAERIRGIVLSNIIVNEGFRRVRAEIDAMPTWEQMTLDAKRREDPLKAFLEEQKQAQSPTSPFAPTMGQGGFRLGVPLGSAPPTMPSQPSASVNAFGSALNRTAQAAIPAVEMATEFLVPGYYFVNETRNQFNAATDAYARGDGWGAIGHGALGVLNGLGVGADIAVGILAPYARVGGGALAAGFAHAAPVAASLADNLSHSLASQLGRTWNLSTDQIAELNAQVASLTARGGGRWGNELTKQELQEIVNAVLREHPEWSLGYGRAGLVHPATGETIMTKGELRIPGPGKAWLADSRPGSRFVDLGFVDENNRLRLLVELADVDKNGQVTERELQAALRAFQQDGYLEREYGARDLQVDVIAKRWQKMKYE